MTAEIRSYTNLEILEELCKIARLESSSLDAGQKVHCPAYDLGTLQSHLIRLMDEFPEVSNQMVNHLDWRLQNFKGVG